MLLAVIVYVFAVLFTYFVLGDACGNLWVFAVVFYDFFSSHMLYVWTFTYVWLTLKVNVGKGSIHGAFGVLFSGVLK